MDREVIERRSDRLAPTGFGPTDHGQVLNQNLATKPVGRPEDAIGSFESLFDPWGSNPRDVLGRIDRIDRVGGALGPRPIRAERATPIIRIR